MNVELYREGRMAAFVVEEEAFRGVRKVAEKVCHDIYLITGRTPELKTETAQAANLVFAGTIGKSKMLEQLEQQGKLDLSGVHGKREVYQISILEHPFSDTGRMLIIAGSDKRGTIYGLFHLSELMGVSPFVDWCGVLPKRQEELVFDEAVGTVSKEPSVRYRGFFINDEWPAFGNWCTKNFGGFNAKAYEHVFELLLRLKGNYLWPAMWSARFEDDGPGLANAELADEYGVVMGMSHHEPCLRQGEEYKYLRGSGSVYGDAWNFRTNREGITRFWEDGLKRSGKFENVITVGMRGEADTAILGKNATLADNIELLRDVLKTQKKLIQENVNADLTKVPRMIALYKEVEEFFYGNEEVKGLMGCEELEDVILMLCDDNFGNLRTLPTRQMRQHSGGYGMYYHFDYHGWPISYEWINSSYLPKVWEQMSMAYDFGIRDLWIVNVGDIGTQEFPLSFFLDLAYDFEAYGTAAINQTEAYTLSWSKKQFSAMFCEEEAEKNCSLAAEVLQGYTGIAHCRRPEAMNAGIYHPVNDKETERLLVKIDELMKKAEYLSTRVVEEQQAAFLALLYYPAMGTMNLYRMQLYAGLNHYFAGLGAIRANDYAQEVSAAMRRDRELVEQYHTAADGKYYGLGLSEHIGFTGWNEDECRNPVLMQVLPANKPRILVCDDASEQHAEGSSWRNQRLHLQAFLEPDVNEMTISLYNISELEAAYEIINPQSWLKCSLIGADAEGSGQCTAGSLNGQDRKMVRILITVDRKAIPEEAVKQGKDGMEQAAGEIRIKTPSGECILLIPVLMEQFGKNAVKPAYRYGNHIFPMTKNYISIEAGHYTSCSIGKEAAAFNEIKPYGKTVSAMKVFPVTAEFCSAEESPFVEYQFTVPENGSYEAELYMQPSNPVSNDNRLLYRMKCNEDEILTCSAIEAEQKIGDMGFSWGEGVLNNIRRKRSPIQCQKGINCLKIYAVTPGFVLEKIVIYPEGKQPGECYLGPVETYYVGRENKKYFAV